jgi:hypothetical protein
MDKKGAKKVREKATLEVPSELMELAKEKAGSRAEILDLNELRAGSWGPLKQGYTRLDDLLNSIDKPEECLESCTKGFHYAYDSKERSYFSGEPQSEVSYVCTNPKCLAQKKAAYTRALNAHGQAKKKAETTAVKQAVVETVAIDHGRMKVLILAQIQHHNYYGDHKDVQWFLNKLKVEPEKNTYGGTDHTGTEKAIMKALDKLTEQDVAKVIVEFALGKLTYDGDIKQYKILTTEPLNWLGVKIPQIPKLPKEVKGKANV